MKVLGIIPARGGSKGIPGKNKKLLLGKPLILYTIEEALKSSLDNIVVSTDDQEIATISRDAGVNVIIRPDELALDQTPTLPVLKHVVDTLSESYDAVMTLQPTSPLRKWQHINEAISLFEKNKDADSLVSVIKVPHNFTPDSLMKMDGKWIRHYNEKRIILRRQEKPILYARNGAAIYLTRIRHLNDYILGGNILPYEMSRLFSIDIDEQDDWILVESLLTLKVF